MNPGSQFFRFLSVGAFGTALHYAILFFLVAALDRDPAIAAMAGATAGAAFNYWLNRRLTFRSMRPHKEALPRFLLIAGLGVVLNGAIVKALTLTALHYLPSQFAATLIILVFNFLLSKLWIFK